MQEILTELIVEWRCWGLLCFAGHRAGYTALAASLAIGCSSTLDSHGRLFVLCIFSRGVVPVFGKCQQSQQENAPGCWMVGSIKRDINFWAALWGTDNSLLKKKTKQNKGRVGGMIQQHNGFSLKLKSSVLLQKNRLQAWSVVSFVQAKFITKWWLKILKKMVPNIHQGYKFYLIFIGTIIISEKKKCKW